MHKKLIFGFRTRLTLKKQNIKLPKEINFYKKVRLSPNLQIEDNSSFYVGRWLWSMGAYSYCSSELPRNTIIGRYCSIGEKISTMGYQHPLDRFTTSAVTYSNSEFSLKNNYIIENNLNENQNITIKNDVWIGANAVLKPGITIGNGAVIACNSVVTKDVPDYAIVGGVPSKTIRYRFSQDTINKLLKLKWWEYDFLDFQEIPLDSNIDDFIINIQKLISSGSIQKYVPAIFTLNKSTTLQNNSQLNSLY